MFDFLGIYGDNALFNMKILTTDIGFAYNSAVQAAAAKAAAHASAVAASVVAVTSAVAAYVVAVTPAVAVVAAVYWLAFK